MSCPQTKQKKARGRPHESLGELKILALDCQTTGAHPDNGRLLEIGWASGCAASQPPLAGARSCLIRSPEDPPVPAAVLRLTGITETALRHSVSLHDAWRHVTQAAEAVAAQNPSGVCPVVIHFARFERPFLLRLHETVDKKRPFPFSIICTHAMAQRLLPHLPRRGLRALAGYFGHKTPRLKRSADHALATLAIWRGLLASMDPCIATLDDLEAWLAAKAPRRATRIFPMHPAVLDDLPHRPGIYRMRRTDREILYIGKAKSLRQRVGSYFRPRAPHPEHILDMLTQARDLDYAETGSALEAALMEADEIKMHCPTYNVALRPEGRDLAYYTRDLLHRCSRGDDRFCLGPLPCGRGGDGLSAFAGWWRTREEHPNGAAVETLAASVPGFCSRHRPGTQCLVEGLDLFRSLHGDRLRQPSALRVVAALGAHLWRRKLLTPVDCASETAHEAQVPPDKPPTTDIGWTPAGIAGALESLLMHAAHMLRRSRWFHLIADCVLAWAAVDAPHKLTHWLRFENGIVRERGSLCAGFPIPAPGTRRRATIRRKDFDLPAYDRMRVVTTELRRLVCENRSIELRLSSTIRLTTCELEKALRWV